MSHAMRWLTMPAVALGWLASVGTVWAVVPQVNDEAKIFSPAAVKKANEDLAEMQRRFKKDLVIETFAKAPENRAAELAKAKTAQERSQVFERWQNERAGTARVNGVHILICMDPKHVHVWVGQSTQKKVITLAERDQLREHLVDKLKQQKHDEALSVATTFVHDQYSRYLKAVGEKESDDEAAAASPRAAGGSSIWRTVLWIGLVVLGVWIGIAILRAIVGAFSGGGGGYAGGPGYGYGGGGGGGFWTGLLGGMFGAMAGNWLYHSFFGGPSVSSWGSSAQAGEPTSDGIGGDDAGQGSSTGGDFGDDAGGDFASDGGGDVGGGDIGGGDFGGGDFGGGDFGGGGDF